jgi:hypothetical protein
MPGSVALETLSAESLPIVRPIVLTHVATHIPVTDCSALRRMDTEEQCEKRLKIKDLLNAGEHQRTKRWRRAWDSNPRYGFP